MWMKVLTSKVIRAGCSSGSVGEDMEKQNHSVSPEPQTSICQHLQGPKAPVTLSKCPTDFIKLKSTANAACP